MQYFPSPVTRKNIKLKNTGPCQFCGAQMAKGVLECVSIYEQAFQLFDLSDQQSLGYRFLSVDAHALQHPEIHGHWSSHFHLTRLHLMLKLQVEWNYRQSVQLNHYLNQFQLDRRNKYLVLPPAGMRGTITAKEVFSTADVEVCKRRINKWACQVYDAWSANHDRITGMATDFLQKLY